MKKLAYLFAGMAAFGLCSCSSDEPSNPEGNIAKGDVAYLNVNIIAGDNNSRGGSSVEGEDFIYGTTMENTVENAYFYFFDENGNYVLESNVWNGGSVGSDKNVEILGKNTVVLTGLTGKSYPTWVVTVLNKPTNVTASAGTTIEQFSKQLVDCYHMSGSNKRFVMSTTSYFGTDNIGTDNKGYYFATKLNKDNFSTTPDKNFAVNPNPAKVVDIYVERLAAAVEVCAKITGNTKKNINGHDMYQVNVSIAGENNPETGANTGTAAEKVYLHILGWDLNATAKQSYVSKDLDGWSSSTTFEGNWAYENAWNHAAYHRSYWGKSTTYGFNESVLAEKLNVGDKTWNGLGLTVVDNQLNGSTIRQYCNETTNKWGNITQSTGENIENQYLALPNATPTVLLKAQICDENGNALNLVNYRGINYLWDNFIVKVLEVTNPNLYTAPTPSSTEGISPINFTQIGKEDVKVVSDSLGTGTVKLEVKARDGFRYYEKQDNGFFMPVHDFGEVNEQLAEATNSTKAIAYNDGMTYYTIPIEHLNNPTGTGALNTREPVEGQYGVVRNHIYSIAINKISSLGNGVYDPEEKLVPETPKDPTYYLESQINILSWKVVSQEAEI